MPGTGERASAGLAGRALLVAALGLLLGGLESGLAVILTYYGALFLLGLPFVGLGARALGLLAADGSSAPIASHLLRPELPWRVSQPGRRPARRPAAGSPRVLFTGYYPAFPWLAYLLAGMALGRATSGPPGCSAWVRPAALGWPSLATLVSRALVDPAVREPYAGGMYGTTPSDGDGRGCCWSRRTALRRSTSRRRSAARCSSSAAACSSSGRYPRRALRSSPWSSAPAR